MHDDRTIADESTILDRAALQMHDMADDAVVSDDCRPDMSGVKNGTVLNRCSLSDSYLAVVSTQNCTGPNRTSWSDEDRTDDHRVRMDERVRVDLGNLITKGIDGHVATVAGKDGPFLGSR